MRKIQFTVCYSTAGSGTHECNFMVTSRIRNSCISIYISHHGKRILVTFLSFTPFGLVSLKVQLNVEVQRLKEFAFKTENLNGLTAWK